MRPRATPSWLTLAMLLGALAVACTSTPDDASTTASTALALPTQPTTSSVAVTTGAPARPESSGYRRMAPPPFDLLEWAVATQGAIDPGPVEPPPPQQTGDRDTFLYSDGFETIEIPAELVYSNDIVAMWFEDGVEFDADTVAQAADRFAREAIDAITSVVGPVPIGIDGDPRVSILHTSALIGSAGEFASYDLLPQSLFPLSNERDMLYVSSDLIVGSSNHLGTLAHELAHLIDHEHRPNRPLWLAEGIAQVAEHAAGFNSVMTHLRYLEKEPVQLNSWGPLQLDDRHYGAGFLYLQYLQERFGDEAVLGVVTSPFEGLGAIEEVLEENDTTSAAFFSDFVAALVTDSSATSTDPLESLLLPPVCGVHTVDEVPWSLTSDTPQYSPRYVRLLGSGSAQVEFDGSTLVGPTTAPARSGESMWWAGPSDDSAATLTRAYDLTALTRATLSFSVWHDTGYGDAAVVMVSDDDGATWSLASGRQAQVLEFGELAGLEGYTGWSGHGTAPEWVEDRIDLSEYAGRAILVRFQYTTDLFEGRQGFAIDDIELLELEITDDAESPDHEWIESGFVRVSGSIGQQWLVQVIEGEENTPVEVNGGSARFTVDLGEGAEATIAVTALTMGTGAPATFDLRVAGPVRLEAPSAGPDTFDRPCSGWEIEDTDVYDLTEEGGELVVRVRGVDAFTWSAKEGTYDEVAVEADMRFGSSIDGAGGLMCRLTPTGFYELNVSGDGFYFLGVADGDDYDVLIDWTASDSISAGAGAINRIGMDCGSEIIVTINGVEVDRVVDDRLPPGEVAVIGSSFANGEFLVAYDNVATSPAPPPDDAVTFDTFDRDGRQWLPYKDVGSRAGRADGEFVLSVLTDDWSAEAYSTDQFSNVEVTAEFRITQAAPDALLGATCHTNDAFDQYLFLLSMDGGFAVQGLAGDDLLDIVPWSFGSGLLIEPDTTNHLRISCGDGKLRWVLNGVLLADVTDSALTGGSVGFVAFTYEYGQFEARLDNILIESPASFSR